MGLGRSSQARSTALTALRSPPVEWLVCGGLTVFIMGPRASDPAPNCHGAGAPPQPAFTWRQLQNTGPSAPLL